MAGRCVMVIELDGGGHRLVYVKVLVRELLAKGYRVVVATVPRTLERSEWAQHLGELPGDFAIHLLEDAQHLTPRMLRSGVADVHPDLVVVPDADAFLVRAALSLWWGVSVPVRALVMQDPRGGGVAPKKALRGWAKRLLVWISGRRRNVTSVWLGQYGDPNPRPSAVAPDPFITDATPQDLRRDAAAYRRRMNLEPDVAWFAMVGGISPRKHVDMVAEAMAAYQRGAAVSVGLLLVGPLDSAYAVDENDLYRSLPASLKVRVDVGLKSNDELNVAVLASDRVVVARDLHVPNSNLIKAVALGRPCLFAAPKFAQDRSRLLPGVEVASLTRDGIISGLERVLQHDPSEMRDGYGVAEFVQALVDEH